MQLSCYFDYTCVYSCRVWRWLERLRGQGVNLEIEWLSFVLKEVNRGEEPSLLEGPGIDSVAVLALAMGEALRESPSVDEFRRDMFDAMHPSEGERAGKDDVLRVAVRNGLDLHAFRKRESRWMERVRHHHYDEVERFGVFGTPTLVIGGEAPIYFKLAELPAGDDKVLWESVLHVAADFPEVAELKRPSPSN